MSLQRAWELLIVFINYNLLSDERKNNWCLKNRLQAHSFSDRWSVLELKHLIRIKVPQNNLIEPFCAKTVIAVFLRTEEITVKYRFDLKKKKMPETASMKQKGRYVYITAAPPTPPPPPPPPVHSPSFDEAGYISFLEIINGNDSKKSQNWTKTMQFQHHVNVAFF